METTILYWGYIGIILGLLLFLALPAGNPASETVHSHARSDTQEDVSKHRYT